MLETGRAPAGAPGASSRQAIIAAFTLAAIGLSLALRFGLHSATHVGGAPLDQLPLVAALLFGGAPLVHGLLVKVLRRVEGGVLGAALGLDKEFVGGGGLVALRRRDLLGLDDLAVGELFSHPP